MVFHLLKCFFPKAKSDTTDGKAHDIARSVGPTARPAPQDVSPPQLQRQKRQNVETSVFRPSATFSLVTAGAFTANVGIAVSPNHCSVLSNDFEWQAAEGWIRLELQAAKGLHPNSYVELLCKLANHDRLMCATLASVGQMLSLSPHSERTMSISAEPPADWPPQLSRVVHLSIQAASQAGMESGGPGVVLVLEHGDMPGSAPQTAPNNSMSQRASMDGPYGLLQHLPQQQQARMSAAVQRAHLMMSEVPALLTLLTLKGLVLAQNELSVAYYGNIEGMDISRHTPRTPITPTSPHGSDAREGSSYGLHVGLLPLLFSLEDEATLEEMLEDVLTMGLAWRRIMRVPVSLVHDAGTTQVGPALQAPQGAEDNTGIMVMPRTASVSRQLVMMGAQGTPAPAQSGSQVNSPTPDEEQAARSRVSSAQPLSTNLYSTHLGTMRMTALAQAAAEVAATTEALVTEGLGANFVIPSASERLSGSRVRSVSASLPRMMEAPQLSSTRQASQTSAGSGGGAALKLDAEGGSASTLGTHHGPSPYVPPAAAFASVPGTQARLGSDVVSAGDRSSVPSTRSSARVTPRASASQPLLQNRTSLLSGTTRARASSKASRDEPLLKSASQCNAQNGGSQEAVAPKVIQNHSAARLRSQLSLLMDSNQVSVPSVRLLSTEAHVGPWAPIGPQLSVTEDGAEAVLQHRPTFSANDVTDVVTPGSGSSLSHSLSGVRMGSFRPQRHAPSTRLSALLTQASALAPSALSQAAQRSGSSVQLHAQQQQQHPVMPVEPMSSSALTAAGSPGSQTGNASQRSTHEDISTQRAELPKRRLASMLDLGSDQQQPPTDTRISTLPQFTNRSFTLHPDGQMQRVLRPLQGIRARPQTIDGDGWLLREQVAAGSTLTSPGGPQQPARILMRTMSHAAPQFQTTDAWAGSVSREGAPPLTAVQPEMPHLRMTHSMTVETMPSSMANAEAGIVRSVSQYEAVVARNFARQPPRTVLSLMSLVNTHSRNPSGHEPDSSLPQLSVTREPSATHAPTNLSGQMAAVGAPSTSVHIARAAETANRQSRDLGMVEGVGPGQVLPLARPPVDSSNKTALPQLGTPQGAPGFSFADGSSVVSGISDAGPGPAREGSTGTPGASSMHTTVVSIRHASPLAAADGTGSTPPRHPPTRMGQLQALHTVAAHSVGGEGEDLGTDFSLEVDPAQSLMQAAREPSIAAAARGMQGRGQHGQQEQQDVMIFGEMDGVEEVEEEQGEEEEEEMAWCWHEVEIKPVVDPVTKDATLLLVQRDVTERAQLENTLSELTEAQLAMLSQIFPRHVIEALSMGESITVEKIAKLARSHLDVTILFMDIVGFTAMSKDVPAEEVIVFLNYLFSRFDRLVEKHGVQKIDTIGDAFIVASGILAPDAEGFKAVDEAHDPCEGAVRVVAFAIDMLRISHPVRMPNGELVSLRIGVHTGPCVSGLVGLGVPKWSVFGDTVNTAARLEQTSPQQCIQISQATVTLLPPELHVFEPTGGVECKGKGVLPTWLWKPPASWAKSAEEGATPTAPLLDLLRQQLPRSPAESEPGHAQGEVQPEEEGMVVGDPYAAHEGGAASICDLKEGSNEGLVDAPGSPPAVGCTPHTSTGRPTSPLSPTLLERRHAGKPHIAVQVPGGDMLQEVISHLPSMKTAQPAQRQSSKAGAALGVSRSRTPASQQAMGQQALQAEESKRMVVVSASGALPMLLQHAASMAMGCPSPLATSSAYSSQRASMPIISQQQGDPTGNTSAGSTTGTSSTSTGMTQAPGAPGAYRASAVRMSCSHMSRHSSCAKPPDSPRPSAGLVARNNDKPRTNDGPELGPSTSTGVVRSRVKFADSPVAPGFAEMRRTIAAANSSTGSSQARSSSLTRLGSVGHGVPANIWDLYPGSAYKHEGSCSPVAETSHDQLYRYQQGSHALADAGSVMPNMASRLAAGNLFTRATLSLAGASNSSGGPAPMGPLATALNAVAAALDPQVSGSGTRPGSTASTSSTTAKRRRNSVLMIAQALGSSLATEGEDDDDGDVLEWEKWLSLPQSSRSNGVAAAQRGHPPSVPSDSGVPQPAVPKRHPISAQTLSRRPPPLILPETPVAHLSTATTATTTATTGLQSCASAPTPYTTGTPSVTPTDASAARMPILLEGPVTVNARTASSAGVAHSSSVPSPNTGYMERTAPPLPFVPVPTPKERLSPEQQRLRLYSEHRQGLEDMLRELKGRGENAKGSRVLGSQATRKPAGAVQAASSGGTHVARADANRSAQAGAHEKGGPAKPSPSLHYASTGGATTAFTSLAFLAHACAATPSTTSQTELSVSPSSNMSASGGRRQLRASKTERALRTLVAESAAQAAHSLPALAAPTGAATPAAAPGRRRAVLRAKSFAVARTEGRRPSSVSSHSSRQSSMRWASSASVPAADISSQTSVSPTWVGFNKPSLDVSRLVLSEKERRASGAAAPIGNRSHSQYEMRQQSFSGEPSQ